VACSHTYQNNPNYSHTHGWTDGRMEGWMDGWRADGKDGKRRLRDLRMVSSTVLDGPRRDARGLLSPTGGTEDRRTEDGERNSNTPCPHKGAGVCTFMGTSSMWTFSNFETCIQTSQTYMYMYLYMYMHMLTPGNHVWTSMGTSSMSTFQILKLVYRHLKRMDGERMERTENGGYAT